MNTGSQKKPRHHGDLRNALIQAGIDILETDGLHALTLRRCAAKAGVSHAAPAHHFAGLDGLRAAIAAEGFDRFRTAMLARRDAVQGDLARLHAICIGYLDFARAHPALFELIFSFRPSQSIMAAVHASSLPAYEVLRDTCAPFVPKGTPPEVIEVQVWSLIHGYAMLNLAGRFPPGIESRDGELLAALDRIAAPS